GDLGDEDAAGVDDGADAQADDQGQGELPDAGAVQVDEGLAHEHPEGGSEADLECSSQAAVGDRADPDRRGYRGGERIGGAEHIDAEGIGGGGGYRDLDQLAGVHPYALESQTQAVGGDIDRPPRQLADPSLRHQSPLPLAGAVLRIPEMWHAKVCALRRLLNDDESHPKRSAESLSAARGRVLLSPYRHQQRRDR